MTLLLSRLRSEHKKTKYAKLLICEGESFQNVYMIACMVCVYWQRYQCFRMILTIRKSLPCVCACKWTEYQYDRAIILLR